MPHQPKRQCGGADDAGPADASKRVKKTTDNPKSIYDTRDGSIESAVARGEWESQFRQGKPVTETLGAGCGRYMLGSPWVRSQYPSRDEMRFEIMSGTRGPGSGSARLCCPRGYWSPDDPNSINNACFIVPFAHMEQVILLVDPEASPASNSKIQTRSETKSKSAKPSASQAEEDHCLVLIIPTAATGSSPIFRTYPQIISFSWPSTRSATDGSLQGMFGEAAAEKETDTNSEETYLSVFNRAFNDQLTHFGKSVIDLSIPDQSQKELLNIPTTLSFRKPMCEEREKISGQISFLPTGAILFLSDSHRLYIPIESFKSTFMLIRAIKSGDIEGNYPFALDMLLPYVGEPFFESERGEDANEQERDDPNDENNGNGKLHTIMLMFKGIPVDRMDAIQEYSGEHKVVVDNCEQAWYDYAGDSPATGFSPIMWREMGGQRKQTSRGD